MKNNRGHRPSRPSGGPPRGPNNHRQHRNPGPGVPPVTGGQVPLGQVPVGQNFSGQPNQQQQAADQYFLGMTAQQNLLGALEQQLQQVVSRAILQALTPRAPIPAWGLGGNPAPSS